MAKRRASTNTNNSNMMTMITWILNIMELTSRGAYVKESLLETTLCGSNRAGLCGREKKMCKRWSKHISPRVRRESYIRTTIIKYSWSDNSVISNLNTRFTYRSTDTQSCQWKEFPRVRKKSLNIPTRLIKGCFGARDGDEMSLVAITTGITDIGITT